VDLKERDARGGLPGARRNAMVLFGARKSKRMRRVCDAAGSVGAGETN
jgi:hypothetical protein